MTKNIYWGEQNSTEWSENFVRLRDEGRIPTIDELNKQLLSRPQKAQ